LEQALGVTTDPSGNVYIAGLSNTSGTSIRFGGNATFSKPATVGFAAFVAQLDSSGIGRWLQWIDGTGNDQAISIATDSQGNVYISGRGDSSETSIRFGNNASYSKPATFGFAAFVGKLDSSGVAQWLQWIDGVGGDFGSGIATDSQGNVYLTGNSDETDTSIRFGDNATYSKPATVGDAAFVGKLDSFGVAQWLQWIDGAGSLESGSALATDTSGNVYMVGVSNTSDTTIRFGDNAVYSKPATTGEAAFVGKLDSSGVGQWLQWIDGAGTTERGMSVATDSHGNVYVSGRSNTTGASIRFGDNASYTKPTTVNEAIFLGKLDSSGIAQWLQWIDGGGDFEQGMGVTTDAQGNVYMTGYSNTTGTSIRFGNNATFSKPSTNTNAGFIAEFENIATVPDPPTAVSAVAGNAQATVSFTAPLNDGATPIISYTVTSSPGGITATGSSSPIIVSGLTNEIAYTFTVVATNSVGNSSPSSPSAAITPVGPNGRLTNGVMLENIIQNFTEPAIRGGFFNVRTFP
jgi:hypothetical protein